MSETDRTVPALDPLAGEDDAAAPGGFVTAQQHILTEQRRFPGASGEFSWLLSGVTLAAKLIADKVRLAGLNDILGEEGAVNVQGERQQKLDVYANLALERSLALRASIGVLASEEKDEPVIVHRGSPDAKYAVIFDPLDGSSNIDLGVSVGTTFCIYHRPHGLGSDDPSTWVLQPGKNLIAAGYVIYGSSTILVYSVGNGVHSFTLNPAIGAFVLTAEGIKMPDRGAYYSFNESRRDSYPEAYRDYLDWLRTDEADGPRRSFRYVGSMVPDFHRTLLKGGVYLYPPTAEQPDGKLRLLYEANVVAFLAEQAGGGSYSGRSRTLAIEPDGLHQRVPLVVGGKSEIEAFRRFCETC
ncbi:MAG: class 1 fructose-bisphosphatase [Planctomycetota bacterium]